MSKGAVSTAPAPWSFSQQCPFGGTTLEGNFVVPADSYLVLRHFDGKTTRIGDKALLAALDNQCEGLFI